MPRKKKVEIEYWLQNCFRCANMLRSHYLNNGVDDGAVSLKCKLSGEYVEPWHIDGCKQYLFGIPEELTFNLDDQPKEKMVKKPK